MAACYLLLGSNLGEPALHLAMARQQISESAGPIVQASKVYQSAAWGYTSDHLFCNQAIQIETTFDPAALLTCTQAIEIKMGREKKSSARWEDRIIDIDILLYDQLIMQTEQLTIPHALLHQRPFALEPLAEIAPQITHPIIGESIAVLHAASITEQAGYKLATASPLN